MANPTKSSAITNLEAPLVVLGRQQRSGGRVRLKSVVHTIPFLNSAIGDTHRLLRFKSGDALHDIRLYSDGAPGAGTADLGIYLANDGAAVDPDFFAGAWAFAAAQTAEATAAQINFRYEASGVAAGAFEVSMGETLWECLGTGIGDANNQDPGVEYDLVLTLTVAVTTPNGILGCEVLYTAGD